MSRAWRKILGGGLAVCAIAAALYLLRRETREITLSMVRDAMAATPMGGIALSLLATAFSLAALAFYEMIAIRAAGAGPLPKRVAILAGAAGNALSNTIGLHAVTITALRYRVYSAAGLTLGAIARITGIAFLGTGLGFIGIMTLALWFDARLWPLAALLTLVLTGFILWLARKPRQIGFRHRMIPLPSAQQAALQVATGIVDIGGAMLAAYVLLPVDVAPNLAHFTLLYIGAALLGIASYAPGGIGVFEATMMTGLDASGRADVLAALLLFRLIYNLLPFGISLLAVLAAELGRRKKSLS